MPTYIPTLLFAGPLRMEYFLLPDGKAYSRLPGGPVLYAAAGAGVWSLDGIGLVSRVGGNFSPQTLQSIQRAGINTDGIRILPKHAPSLGFHYYESWEKHIDWDPLKFYTRFHLPCPDELLEYVPPSREESSLHPFPEIATRPEDLPAEYRQARAAYIAPGHYQSQLTLSVALRQSGTGILLLSPPEGLWLPAYRSQVRGMLHGIDILFAREEAVKAFVGESGSDAAALSECLARWGPTIVLLQRDLQGIHVYDSASRRALFFPFYPVEMRNPLAIGDSFCGGFISAWRRTFDVVESALAGCISASLAMEGMGGLYALDRNPGLVEARISSMRRSLKT
jgi:sugar/nucleoside kinase (ribokinase family)